MIELIIIIVLIAVLGFCLGFGANAVVAGIIILIALFVATMLVLFMYSLIRLVTSKKTSAEFAKIDKSPKGKFDSAFYKIDEKEYPCAFPAEVVMRDAIYKKDKEYSVFLNEKKGFVYDRNAVITCVTGFIFSLAAAVTAAIFFLSH